MSIRLNIILFVLSYNLILNCTADNQENTTQGYEIRSSTLSDNNDGMSPKSIEFDFDGIASHCNESFRITMDYLIEFNATGSFPDESDKTPMV